MRHAFVGVLIGLIAGIALGASVITPNMLEPAKVEISGPHAAPETGEPSEASNQTVSRAQAEQGSDIRLSMASHFPATLPAYGTVGVRLSKHIYEASSGKVELRFHEPGRLVGDTDALDAITSGTIEALFTSLDHLVDRDPAFSVLAGPPFGKSIAAYFGWIRSTDGAAYLRNAFQRLNVHGELCGLIPHKGGAWFSSPLVSNESFSGLRVRATGITATLYEELGASVTRLPLVDIPIALESGKIDGSQVSTPHVDVTLGIPPSGGVYYLPGWRRPAEVLTVLVHKDVWSTLSTAQKRLLASVCGDNIQHTMSEGETLQFAALKEIAKRDVDVRPWPTFMQIAMREAWEKTAAAMADESSDFATVFKSYQTYLEGQSIWEELARPK